MTVQIYNTASRSKQPLVPIDPSNVRMYVCGPTVYDFAHIGNARPVIVFDVLYRLLRHVYGADHVTYVRNITDVDDKINARAVRDFPDMDLNEAIRRVTEGTAAQYQADVTELGNLPPDVQPRATEHLPEMIVLTERIIAGGFAYEAEGHVLFHVPSMPDYGKLSGRSVDDMIAGARVDVAPFKRDAMDFVLWKPSDEGQPGWPSPWGRGRPGWHIECSAMAWKHLGETFDIHGGGIDLAFPHHENELAQSRCAHGTPVMANIWMHNGFLQVEGEKMSKSLGNFFTIRDLLNEWPGGALRFNMLRTHYRQPIDWTRSALFEAFNAYFALADISRDFDPADRPNAEVVEALSNDLNTPLAISVLQSMAAKAKKGDYAAGAELAASMDLLGLPRLPFQPQIIFRKETDPEQIVSALMGLFPKNYPVGRALEVLRNSKPDGVTTWEPRDLLLNWLSAVDPNALTGSIASLGARVTEINGLLGKRLDARAAKDWAESDRIRSVLGELGVTVDDRPTGSVWKIK